MSSEDAFNALLESLPRDEFGDVILTPSQRQRVVETLTPKRKEEASTGASVESAECRPNASPQSSRVSSRSSDASMTKKNLFGGNGDNPDAREDIDEEARKG